MINRVMVIEGDRRRVFEADRIDDAHWLYWFLRDKVGHKNVFLLDPSGHQYKLGYEVKATPVPISQDTMFTGPAADRLKSEIVSAALEQEKQSASTPPRHAGRKPRPPQVQD